MKEPKEIPLWGIGLAIVLGVVVGLLVGGQFGGAAGQLTCVVVIGLVLLVSSLLKTSD
jgi:hypothetical protein